jgi:hypothetical protein
MKVSSDQAVWFREYWYAPLALGVALGLIGLMLYEVRLSDRRAADCLGRGMQWVQRSCVR